MPLGKLFDKIRGKDKDATQPRKPKGKSSRSGLIVETQSTTFVQPPDHSQVLVHEHQHIVGKTVVQACREVRQISPEGELRGYREEYTAPTQAPRPSQHNNSNQKSQNRREEVKSKPV